MSLVPVSGAPSWVVNQRAVLWSLSSGRTTCYTGRGGRSYLTQDEELRKVLRKVCVKLKLSEKCKRHINKFLGFHMLRKLQETPTCCCHNQRDGTHHSNSKQSIGQFWETAQIPQISAPFPKMVLLTIPVMCAISVVISKTS